MDSYIFTTEGKVREAPEPKGEQYTIADIQGIVGGYVSRIPTPIHSLTKGRVDLVTFVNEDALLDGLPLNPLGTLLLGSCADSIYGDVLICPTSKVRT